MKNVVLPLFLAVTACAGPIETRVESAGVALLQPTNFQIDESASPLAAPAVLEALSAKGFRNTSDGPLSLQIALSQRPANLSLLSDKGPISASARKKRCAKLEYRLGITMTRISDGVLAYRGSAAEFHCKDSIQVVMPALVKAALADLGAPRGAYIVTRPRSGEFRLIPAAGD
jgi:hypothetical protein